MINPLVLVEQCYNALPSKMKEKPWTYTDHGRKVLQTEDELNAYIAAYGEMHVIKCRAAMQNFPFNDLENYSFEIFDWGCGQGLATLVLLDMLHDRGKVHRLKKIYLIEPSSIALARAKSWVTRYGAPGIEVIAVNKSIPSQTRQSMPISCSSRISINLFSNILDIREISLQWLSQKVSSLANRNYIVCVGPKFIQNTNTRIADFCGYFNPNEYFSNISSYPYAYTTKTKHAYGCETRCFVHSRGQELNTTYVECADEHVLQDPYEYPAECLSGVADEKLIKFYDSLLKEVSPTFDVFFRPVINCDAVDFILLSKSNGVILINSCEHIDDIEEEYSRIKKIKDNFFNSHLKSLKIDFISERSVYNNIKIALFFPNSSLAEIKNKLQTLQEDDSSYDFLYYFVPSVSPMKILKYIRDNGFKSEYYQEIIGLISSNWHSYKDGDLNLKLTDRQKYLVRRTQRKMRVKGVSGSGKTQVVANRAVEQHIKTGDKVLIITFNISLIQYIRMRIFQVPADFSPSMFEITNYHQFFLTMANRYAKKEELWDANNPNFFDPYRNKIQKYRTIIIDEVQDFQSEWIESIKQNFLAVDGSISIFGDGEQNIYNRGLDAETKMPVVQGFDGRWNEMSERVSMRFMNPHIATLSSEFAIYFGLSDSALSSSQRELLFDEDYYINYWDKQIDSSNNELVHDICDIINDYELNVADTVVLASSIQFLRGIEEEYVKQTGLKTMITFETESQFQEVWCHSKYIKSDLEDIRRVAKVHFSTNCEEIKMSTIHSFKGWESKNVILFLQPDNVIDKNENSDALIYTAMTRARCNLFIISLGNEKYDEFFRKNVNI